MTAAPEPGVSGIRFFSGVQETCLNLWSPVLFVSSKKITGAPSQNPPAVIGRCFSSSTGAKTPPVDAPPDWDGACGFGISCALACCPLLADAIGTIVTLRTQAVAVLETLRISLILASFLIGS